MRPQVTSIDPMVAATMQGTLLLPDQSVMLANALVYAFNRWSFSTWTPMASGRAPPTTPMTE
ncbi:hypothetical protein [Pseudomonas fluorescens]|uniref:hypothetical protein n=1 Tax=Pseudomonas fluorescens TaxID=294 RepID=UPI00124304C1|nr:hypothetical protein [Pseudomonas fluorescens]